MTKAPIFSIITVVLNRAYDIRYTLESIVNQTYPHIQFIVVDGKSTDGTVDIIKEYSDKIETFISDSDNGIYDAMNKGLRAAKGNYILFINGGDALHDVEVLSKMAMIAQAESTLPDILYGECLFVDRDRNVLGTRSALRRNPLPKKLNHDSFRLGSNVAHQSFAVKRNLCPQYDLRYRFSSDIDWMLKCIQKAELILNVHFIISDFVLGDSTQQFYTKSMIERFKILSKHYGLFNAIMAHAIILFMTLRGGISKLMR